MSNSLVFPAIIACLFGTALGSFANVVIYRVPRKLSVVNPPSACPYCDEKILARDNLPVVGWLLLRGRCRRCGSAISVQYPLVELIVGLSFAAIVVWAAPRYWLILMVFSFATVVLSLIDLQTRKLPNAITYPLIFTFIAAAVFLGFLDAEGLALTGRALVAGMAVFVFYAVVWFIYPRGIGLGDVKLAPSLGLVLGVFGWGSVVIGVFGGFLIGSFVGVLAMVKAKKTRKVAIPFGPSMIAGAWAGILWGDALWNGYLSLVGL